MVLIANQRSTLIKICDQKRIIQGKKECKHIMLTARMCNARIRLNHSRSETCNSRMRFGQSVTNLDCAATWGWKNPNGILDLWAPSLSLHFGTYVYECIIIVWKNQVKFYGSVHYMLHIDALGTQMHKYLGCLSAT